MTITATDPDTTIVGRRADRPPRTGVLGLALCADELHRDLFDAQLLSGVVRAAARRDLAVVPWLAEVDGPHLSCPHPASGLDGLIVDARSTASAPIAAEIAMGVPTVVIGRGAGVPGCQVVDADHALGAEATMEHLVSLGRTRIAVICGGLEYFDCILRLDAFERVRRDAGLDLDPRLVAMGNFSIASGRREMERLLPLAPDAVFAMNDLMALGALHALQSAGLRVPDDVAIAGFDDLLDPDTSSVPFTTVRQPARQMGERAVRALVDLIEGAAPGDDEIVPVELVVRASTIGA
jgi:DNA-binding LacI/PurR family transcriptional regulator